MRGPPRPRPRSARQRRQRTSSLQWSLEATPRRRRRWKWSNPRHLCSEVVEDGAEAVAKAPTALAAVAPPAFACAAGAVASPSPYNGIAAKETSSSEAVSPHRARQRAPRAPAAVATCLPDLLVRGGQNGVPLYVKGYGDGIVFIVAVITNVVLFAEGGTARKGETLAGAGARNNENPRRPDLECERDALAEATEAEDLWVT